MILESGFVVDFVGQTEVSGDIDVESRRIFPKSFDIVFVSFMAVKDVYDDVCVIEKDPLSVSESFGADALPHMSDICIDTGGDTIDVAIASSGADDEVIGIIAFSPDVDDDGFNRFFIDSGFDTCSGNLFARVFFHSNSRS